MASTQTVSPWAHGLAVFAGVVMVVGGAFQALEGLAGIVNDKYLVVLPNYLYAFDLTVWGVIHLLVGLALVVIGVSLLRGQTWAASQAYSLPRSRRSSTSSGCRSRPGGPSCSSRSTCLSSGRSRNTCVSQH